MQTRTSEITIEQVGRSLRLSCAQRLPAAVETVFPFFAAPENLERLTPSFLQFRIQRPPVLPLRNGSLIDYRLQLHGVPVWWRTRIEDWSPPLRFIDVQVRGPFRRWRHLHEFSAVGGETLVTDTVLYDVYCRRLYATRALGWIDSDLRRIFVHRQTQIARIFAGDERRDGNEHQDDQQDGYSHCRAHSQLGPHTEESSEGAARDESVE